MKVRNWHTSNASRAKETPVVHTVISQIAPDGSTGVHFISTGTATLSVECDKHELRTLRDKIDAELERYHGA